MRRSAIATGLTSAALILGLAGVGLWSFAAAKGYELGKRDATHAIQPYGVVIVQPNGACRVYDTPGETVTVEYEPALAHLTTVVRLKR